MFISGQKKDKTLSIKNNHWAINLSSSNHERGSWQEDLTSVSVLAGCELWDKITKEVSGLISDDNEPWEYSRAAVSLQPARPPTLRKTNWTGKYKKPQNCSTDWSYCQEKVFFCFKVLLSWKSYISVRTAKSVGLMWIRGGGINH